MISRRCISIVSWGVVADGRLRAICWRATFARRLRSCVTDSPVHLRKRHDPESGLALIAPSSD